jgi:hypothetical protein
VDTQPPNPRQLKSISVKPQEKWWRRKKKILKRIGFPATIFGGFALVFSLFPHLKISDPTTMNPNKFMSKYTTLTNDGVLPVFGVRCLVRISQTLDNYGSGLENLTLEKPNWYVGTLSPGSSYTFSPERVLGFPYSQVQTSDFDISVSYIPILPPVRMEKCIHLVAYQASDGQFFGFQTPASCPWFPWLHF